MISEQSIRRSVLWAAYGDALGFITEMRGTDLKSEGILRRRTGGTARVSQLAPWVRRVGGRFGVTVRLMAGCYSDDTQLRLSTCRSIRGDGTFDVEAFSKVEMPLWASYALGAGRGTKTAANWLRRRDTQWNSNFFESQYASYLNGGGNGAAMRIQPHVWCASEGMQDVELMKDVVRNTVTTHGHVRALLGAGFHALCLRHALLKGAVPSPEDWFKSLEQLRLISSLIRSDDELLMHWLPTWEERTGESIEDATSRSLTELRQDMIVAQEGVDSLSESADADRGYRRLVQQMRCLENDSIGSAIKTALLAAYISYVFRGRPHEGLAEAANMLGSDTDTISTMAGAILGSVADVDPPEAVADAEYLEKEAARLYELSQGRLTTSHDYPDLLYWQPPSSQLDAMGCHEGKWFLQGLGEADPVGDPIERGGKNPIVWQWFRLKFGQSVLMKRRKSLRPVPAHSLPVSPDKGDPGSTQSKGGARRSESAPDERTHAQPQLWDVGRHGPEEGKTYITIDAAAELCARSGWRTDLVGEMLLKLAAQDRGVEKAIGFAAIAARSSRALRRKDRSSDSGAGDL